MQLQNSSSSGHSYFTQLRSDYLRPDDDNEDYVNGEEEQTLGTESDNDDDARTRRPVSCDLLYEARQILDKVVRKYGSGDAYLQATYGRKINCSQATERLLKYLYENNLDQAVTVIWSKKLSGSALMVARAGLRQSKLPENRKYVLYLKDSEDNPYLREQGIYCLINHEVFTHYVRFFNDGLQAWNSNRKRFDLKSLNSVEFADTEEGLAVLHSMLAANESFLFLPALSYYSTCLAKRMSFVELYAHLAKYMPSPEVRWKYATRATTLTKDHYPNAKDQCYFAGAVEILRNAATIDFRTLIAGKIALSDVPRIRRVVRHDVIRVPDFMKPDELYRSRLLEIAVRNELVAKTQAFPAICKAARKHAILNRNSPPPSNMIVAKNNSKRFTQYAAGPNGDALLTRQFTMAPTENSILMWRQKSDFQIVLKHSIEEAPKEVTRRKSGDEPTGDEKPTERIVKTWKMAIPSDLPPLPRNIATMFPPRAATSLCSLSITTRIKKKPPRSSNNNILL